MHAYLTSQSYMERYSKVRPRNLFKKIKIISCLVRVSEVSQVKNFSATPNTYIYKYNKFIQVVIVQTKGVLTPFEIVIFLLKKSSFLNSYVVNDFVFISASEKLVLLILHLTNVHF